ncbi:hypothetical protein PAPYR_1975 [Paratrimastix pyriformis]|uniref:Uncharacterized protein n=1 Tax=Paratrimastix pyriformis TaxID=342808 RepID=A0ABQ8UQG7_9EUKA|nr:hypothetical protein PAPYR_1975 [Paratrimastix pyriformis]
MSFSPFQERIFARVRDALLDFFVEENAREIARHVFRELSSSLIPQALRGEDHVPVSDEFPDLGALPPPMPPLGRRNVLDGYSLVPPSTVLPLLDLPPDMADQQESPMPRQTQPNRPPLLSDRSGVSNEAFFGTLGASKPPKRPGGGGRVPALLPGCEEWGTAPPVAPGPEEGLLARQDGARSWRRTGPPSTPTSARQATPSPRLGASAEIAEVVGRLLAEEVIAEESRQVASGAFLEGQGEGLFADALLYSLVQLLKEERFLIAQDERDLLVVSAFLQAVVPLLCDEARPLLKVELPFSTAFGAAPQQPQPQPQPPEGNDQPQQQPPPDDGQPWAR